MRGDHSGSLAYLLLFGYFAMGGIHVEPMWKEKGSCNLLEGAWPTLTFDVCI